MRLRWRPCGPGVALLRRTDCWLSDGLAGTLPGYPVGSPVTLDAPACAGGAGWGRGLCRLPRLSGPPARPCRRRGGHGHPAYMQC